MRNILFLLVAIIAIGGAYGMATAEPPHHCDATCAHAAAVSCPFGDGNFGLWTGQTKFVNGQTWFEMRCVSGHTWLSLTTQ